MATCHITASVMSYSVYQMPTLELYSSMVKIVYSYFYHGAVYTKKAFDTQNDYGIQYTQNYIGLPCNQ